MWQKFRRLLRCLTQHLVTEDHLEKCSSASRRTTKLNCKSSAEQAEESWKVGTSSCQFLKIILQNAFTVLHNHFSISEKKNKI